MTLHQQPLPAASSQRPAAGEPASHSQSAVLYLSGPILGAALTAFSALYLTETSANMFSPVLPCLTIALGMSRFLPFRMEKTSRLNWLISLLLFSLIVIHNRVRFASETVNIFETNTAALFGEIFAAELTLQAWRQPPAGTRAPRSVTILLSGLVFMAACVTFNAHLIPWLLPLYILFIVLSLRTFGAAPASRKPEEQADRVGTRHNVIRGIVLALVLGIGAASYHTIRFYRNEVTSWAMNALRETNPPSTVGLSLSPQLGETFGQSGSTNRALRIEGSGNFSHLRAMAFDAYHRGGWGPEHNARAMTPVSNEELRASVRGNPVRITRFLDNENILFTPLNAIGVDATGNGELQWDREDGGPLKGDLPASTSYTVILNEQDDFQGPFCLPPGEAYRNRLLTIPAEVDSRVKELAQQVAGRLPDARQKVEAITDYLQSHHSYSLRYRPGPGDPVSNFLLTENAAAHCEFFASSAVILLRGAGVPSRYIVGYYAHESDEPGVTVVRQRDAHAWAEAWIAGVGWVVVDATPGNGRPDQLSPPPPFWLRWLEWCQDHLAALRAWLTGPNGWKAGAGAGALLILYVLWQFRRQGRAPRSGKAAPFAYASPGEELTALSARFETLCRKQGLICPPGRTWQEFLTDPPNTASTNRPAFTLEQARDFLRAYNTLRFGGAITSEALTDLRERLDRME